jgi:anti-sigma B factor antagonist
METTRPVVVKHVPEKLGWKEARAFFHDVQPLLTMDRPQLVFDLSMVRQFDAAGVEMLLECMSEVMKRDGDLKLAALSPEATVIMELTRTDRLFEIYQTAADAVRSFTRYVPYAMRNQPFGSSAAANVASSPPDPSVPSRPPSPKTDAAA